MTEDPDRTALLARFLEVRRSIHKEAARPRGRASSVVAMSKATGKPGPSQKDEPGKAPRESPLIRPEDEPTPQIAREDR